MATQVTTEVGRIVWGNPLIAKPKLDDNKKPVLDDQGKPIMQYAFGVAIPKTHFGAVSAAMGTEAATVYPQGVPPSFAWKVKDGDGFDDEGKPFNTREGYAGCYVLSVSTESFGPRVVRLNGGAYSDMTDGIKTGDYVRVALTLKAHSGKANVRGSKPGIYINPNMVEFIGYGEAIQNGPDAMVVFGGQQVALPPGASAVPLAPQGAMPGGYAPPGAPAAHPMQPGQGYAPPGQAPAFAPAAVPPGTPGAGYGMPPGSPPMTASPSSPPAPPAAPPHHGFVQNAAPGMPGQFAPSPGPGYAPMPGQPPR